MAQQIGVFDFQVGQAIQSIYLNPSDGRARTILLDRDGNYILNFVADCTKKVVSLSVKVNDKFSDGVTLEVSTYDFAPQKKVTVDLIATEESFLILTDGQQIYDYKHKLPITSLRTVRFDWVDKTGVPPELQQLAVKFAASSPAV